ncbi:MAG: pitrilysin family protein [Roseovarius sp.]|nr:pitrilysin family protein [Roseovarius sp.]MCY4292073.1 pitrilysin family protein [Roseovarius sp.]
MVSWRKIMVLLFGLPHAFQAAAGDDVAMYRLDNGMDVVVVEDHRAPVAIHMVWYRVGSADEPPGKSGIAHFLEHLMFKGTDELEPGEFSLKVAKTGGTDNAFTSYDYTTYIQRVATEHLESMMRMESDRMVNLVIDKDLVDIERNVVLEERNQRVENNPSALYHEQHMAAQYLNHPYGIPIIGWRREILRIDIDDLRKFYDTHYAPNNATLVVVGDVDPEEIYGLARKYYGEIPARQVPERGRPLEPGHLAARKLEFGDARIAQPYLTRSYLVPERDSGDQKTAAALTLLAEVLGGGTTSILNQKLQFDTRTALYAGSYYRGLSLDETTFFITVVPTRETTLEEAEASMDEVLSDFLQNGIDDNHLERVKRQIRASEIYARDSIRGIANRYGRALSSGLTVSDVQAWPDILQSITEKEIMAAAKTVFAGKNSVTGYIMASEGAK